MKIIDITTYQISGNLKVPFWWGNGGNSKRDASLVKIETDEGIVGWGEGWGDIFQIINNVLKPAVLNQDPMSREQIWSFMFDSLNNPLTYPGLGGSAMSAIDIALWDIVGKKLQVPVHVLLGGKVKDKIHCYATGLYYTHLDLKEEISERVKEAKLYEQRGFNAMKIKIGALSVEEDIERVVAVKDSLKEETRLMVDANQAYDLRTAKYISDKLYDIGIYFFEEPIMGLDVEGYSELTRYSKVRIAGGESLRTRYQFKDFINRHGFDIAQPDVGNVGGISEFKKVQSLAYANGVHVYPHVWGSCVMISASIHLASTFTNLPITTSPSEFIQEPLIEFDQSENPIRYSIERNNSLEFKDGYITVPSKPGLGIEINEESVEKMNTLNTL